MRLISKMSHSYYHYASTLLVCICNVGSCDHMGVLSSRQVLLSMVKVLDTMSSSVGLIKNMAAL